MGADMFSNRAMGATLSEAFRACVEQAQWEHGHGGYSGTIAEKNEVVEIEAPVGVAPGDFAAMVYTAMGGEWQTRRARWADLEPRIVQAVNKAAAAGDDKWGPAIAIEVEPGVWDIMGWAGS